MIGRAVRGYLIGALALSLGLGVARSLWLFWIGTLPDQYLLHGVLWNAGVAFSLGLVLLPGVLIVHAVGSRLRPLRAYEEDTLRASSLGALLGMFAVCAPFWVLSSSLEYRDPSTWSAALIDEAPLWLSIIAALFLLWWVLLRKRSAGVVIRRCGASCILSVLITGGLWAYGITRDPSAALPLELEATALRRPPVFLVLIDTLRADHLPLYGYPKPTSPNLDALGTEAVVYERAFSQASWTRPSCGSLLTSRFPPEIGLRGMWDPLPPDVPILPQFMQVEGYKTAGIVSSVHLSAQYGFDKGWDMFDMGTSYLRYTGVVKVLSRLRLIGRQEVYPRYKAEELTNRAIQWIKAQEGNEAPLFMYLHYSDPHAPYLPPTGQDRWREFASSEEAQQVSIPPMGPPVDDGQQYTPAQLEAMVARYDAEIAYFDDHFGRFLDFLKNHGIYDEALIIITADHGEEFGEHGGWSHGHSLYNELLHVPLIVKYPASIGVAADRVNGLTGLIDVVPTIRDVIAAGWPESSFRGRSLLAGDLASASRFIYADNETPALRVGFKDEDKLIQILDANGTVADERYYSLATDFGELGDGELPPAKNGKPLDEMRGLMEALYDQVLTSGEIEVDESTLDELRALGYIE